MCSIFNTQLIITNNKDTTINHGKIDKTKTEIPKENKIHSRNGSTIIKTPTTKLNSRHTRRRQIPKD